MQWNCVDDYILSPPPINELNWTCADALSLTRSDIDMKTNTISMVNLGPKQAPAPSYKAWSSSTSSSFTDAAVYERSLVEPTVWWIFTSPKPITCSAVAIQNGGSGFVQLRYATESLVDEWIRLASDSKAIATTPIKESACFRDDDILYSTSKALTDHKSTATDIGWQMPQMVRVHDILSRWPVLVPKQQLLTASQYVNKTNDRYNRWWTVDLSSFTTSLSFVAIGTTPLTLPTLFTHVDKTVGLSHVWFYP